MQRGVHQRHDQTLHRCTFALCLQFRQLAEKKASRAAARLQAKEVKQAGKSNKSAAARTMGLPPLLCPWTARHDPS